MTVTQWTFELWTAYFVDFHTFTLHLHLQTNQWLLFLTIEQEMHSNEWLLLSFCSWLMVKRHGCKPSKGRNCATFQGKCVLCLKSDSQY